jgi:hypothetical protein
VSLHHFLERNLNCLPLPLEAPHIEEAVRVLGGIAETVRWLSKEREKNGTGTPPAMIWEFFDRAKTILELFNKDAATVEFIAVKVEEFKRRGTLGISDRRKLTPLLKKAAGGFDPFRNRQFESVETLDGLGSFTK